VAGDLHGGELKQAGGQVKAGLLRQKVGQPSVDALLAHALREALHDAHLHPHALLQVLEREHATQRVAPVSHRRVAQLAQQRGAHLQRGLLLHALLQPINELLLHVAHCSRQRVEHLRCALCRRLLGHGPRGGLQPAHRSGAIVGRDRSQVLSERAHVGVDHQIHRRAHRRNPLRALADGRTDRRSALRRRDDGGGALCPRLPHHRGGGLAACRRLLGRRHHCCCGRGCRRHAHCSGLVLAESALRARHRRQLHLLGEQRRRHRAAQQLVLLAVHVREELRGAALLRVSLAR
jgi:hypothetical protein